MSLTRIHNKCKRHKKPKPKNNMNTEAQQNRENVEISKLVSEMMNLIADTRKKDEERENLRKEREKMHAETTKIEAEIKWYPAVVGAALLGAGVAIAKLFL